MKKIFDKIIDYLCIPVSFMTLIWIIYCTVIGIAAPGGLIPNWAAYILIGLILLQAFCVSYMMVIFERGNKNDKKIRK